MTIDEAIEVLSDFDKQVSAKADGAYQSTIGEMACKVAINALEEIQQYREIGTVEELTILEKSDASKEESSIEYYNKMREYRDMLAAYKEIGTVEEVMELKEQNIALRNRCKIFTKGQLCIFCPIRCEERAEEYRNAEGSGEE